MGRAPLQNTVRALLHGIRRLELAAIALAVAALLLLSSPVSARLVEEVPLNHWSYAALERLAATGFVDPARHPVSPRHPLTRFELASATKEALETLLSLLNEKDGDADESAAPPGLVDYVAAFMSQRAGSGERRSTEDTPARVVQDLRALAEEFAEDISRLGGLRAHVTRGAGGVPGGDVSWLEIVRGVLNSESTARPTADARPDATRGVSLDAIIAALESGRRGAESRSVGLPLAVGSTASPATQTAYDLAAYDLEVLGLQMRTTLGYSFVDIDRLRELSSGSVVRGEASCTGEDCLQVSGRGGADSPGLPRFHVAGVAPLGDAVSVRIGYELRTADALASSLESVVGAGLEYRLGERANVIADVRWTRRSGMGQGEAGVGFGYRLGDSTTLIATYSLVSFESARDALESGLGEAELEVRF